MPPAISGAKQQHPCGYQYRCFGIRLGCTCDKVSKLSLSASTVQGVGAFAKVVQILRVVKFQQLYSKLYRPAAAPNKMMYSAKVLINQLTRSEGY